MIPFFAAQLFPAGATANFTLTLPGVGGSPFAVAVTIPATAYYLGGSNSASNLWTIFAAALNASSPGTFGFGPAVAYTDPAYGTRVVLTYTGTAVGNVTIAPLDAPAQLLLEGLGFIDGTATLTLPAPLSVGSVSANAPPLGCWHPKAHNTQAALYVLAQRQVSTSPLAGSGVGVTGTQQDDGTRRSWRIWDIRGIPGARALLERAKRPDFAALAGITIAPDRCAIDGPDGWHTRVVSGRQRFVAVEDEAQTGSATLWSEYRIVYSDEAPVGMAGFRGLRDPVLTSFAPAGGRQSLRFSALATGLGNFPTAPA
jgi:hypothetical protein